MGKKICWSAFIEYFSALDLTDGMVKGGKELYFNLAKEETDYLTVF